MWLPLPRGLRPRDPSPIQGPLMARLLPLLLLVFALPMAASAASPVGEALPAGSEVLAMLPLGPHQNAVVYRSGSAYVGVVGIHGRPQLMWHRKLPFAPSELFATTRHGSFGGIGTAPGGTEGEFFAFRVAGNHVHAALEGGADGLRTAAEGVHLSHGDVTLRVHDDMHQGSVSYSLVTRYQWQSTRYVPV